MAAKFRKGIFLWTLALVAAALVLALSVRIIEEAIDAGEWPTVDGKILSSTYRLGCGRSGRDPFPDVQYEYRYNGKKYTGNRIALDTTFCGWASPAQTVSDQYKLGQAVLVHVEPDRPHRSVLRAGAAQPQSYWLLAGAVAGLLISGYKVFSKVRSAA